MAVQPVTRGYGDINEEEDLKVAVVQLQLLLKAEEEEEEEAAATDV